MVCHHFISTWCWWSFNRSPRRGWKRPFSTFKRLISRASICHLEPTTDSLFLPGSQFCSQREHLLFPHLRASCFEVSSPIFYWVQITKTKDHAIANVGTFSRNPGNRDFSFCLQAVTTAENCSSVTGQAWLPVPTLLSYKIFCYLARVQEMSTASSVPHHVGNTKFSQTVFSFTILLNAWKYLTSF